MDRKQSLLLASSVLFFVFTLIFAHHLVTRELPPPKKVTLPYIKPTLPVLAVQSQDHPIRVLCYGTVTAEKIVSLRAAVAGKVLEAKEIYPGKNVSPREVLFEIEKTKIDFAIQQHHLEINDLTLQSKEFETRVDVIKKQLHNAKEHYDLSIEALNNQEANYRISKELFEKSKNLFEHHHISNSEYLRQESGLRSAETLLINTQQQVESAEDAINQLKLSLKGALIAAEQVPNKIKILRIKIASLQDDRQKSDVSADFPAEIISTHVHDGQEVQIGTQLAIIRSTDAIELHVNIPDHYFNWLYEGDLLENPENHAVEIRLVNSHFRKHFYGAWIKSAAESVNIPTRSLPVIIGRRNPRDENGDIIAKEELKPGMYCEVLIELCKAKNSFFIPYEAIQGRKKLYHVTMEGGNEEMTLSVIDNFEVLYEEEEGLIIRLPDHYEHLLLVSEPFKKGKAGMQVAINKLE